MSDNKSTLSRVFSDDRIRGFTALIVGIITAAASIPVAHGIATFDGGWLGWLVTAVAGLVVLWCSSALALALCAHHTRRVLDRQRRPKRS